MLSVETMKSDSLPADKERPFCRIDRVVETAAGT